MDNFDIVTRELASLPLTKRKHARLVELSKRLGIIRTEIRHEFGGMPRKLNSRAIRDEWLEKGKKFNVPARLWKEILRDTIDNLNAYNEAGFTAIAKNLYRDFGKEIGKEKAKLLRNGDYVNDKGIHRRVRKAIVRSYNSCHNQIVLDSCCYTAFEKDGNAFIKVSCLEKGKRLVIPLKTNRIPQGTIRLVTDANTRILKILISVKVYHTQTSTNELGVIGVDKGLTEVAKDNLGNKYGTALYEKQQIYSDYINKVYRGRNKLFAIYKRAKEQCDYAKAERIRKNNLGRKKVTNRKEILKNEIKVEINLAIKEICSKAKEIVIEDLSHSFSSKNKGAKANRSLNFWMRGVIDEALVKHSKRYGVPLFYVNAAYTSQMDSLDYSLSGVRKGDKFYRENGEVLDADVNGASNILTRRYDTEIKLWHSPKQVKDILSRRSLETAQAVLQLRYADQSNKRKEERITKDIANYG